jgi:hypothetical protein
MIPLPTGVRVWIAAGHTDMRRGMQGLARQVQETLQPNSKQARVLELLRRPTASAQMPKFGGKTGRPDACSAPTPSA